MWHAAALNGRTLLQALAVEAFEEQALVARHAAQVVPLLALVVRDGGRLADVTTRIAMLDGDEIALFEGGARREAQRHRLDRLLVERAPDVDDAEAPLEKRLGLVAHVPVHALLGRVLGLVDVHELHGLAVGVGRGAAHRVVEQEHPAASRDVVEQQLLDLRVVVGLDGLVVGELDLLGLGHPLDDLEGVVVERVLGLAAADVLDRHFLLELLDVPLRLVGRRRVDVVEGYLALGRRAREVQLDADGAMGKGSGCRDRHCG